VKGHLITFLKVADASGVKKVISGAASAGGKYLRGAASLGSRAVGKAGGGEVSKALGATAALGAAAAAPVIALRYEPTGYGRKFERAAGKGLGAAGRGAARAGQVVEQGLTAKDWGSRAGETY